jgi:hypothetical protein
MIERLARAIEHVDDLPPEVQEELAEQIEGFRREPDVQAPRQLSGHRGFAGIWRDLPDDMEETLLRWRREATPTSPMEDQLRWNGDAPSSRWMVTLPAYPGSR